MRRFVSSWWVAVTLVSSPAVALAQEGKTFPECTHAPSERDISAAKGAFEAGQVSFHEADYARAILYWEDAFRRDCTALALLLNLARAYELAEQKAHAVSALETYLARRPNAADRDQILRRLEVLRRQLDEEREAARREAEPDPAQSAPSRAPEPLPAVEEAPTASTQAPVWPLFVAGGGLATSVVGVVLWAVNQSTINDCSKESAGVYVCRDAADKQAAEDALPRRNVGIGLTLGGGAVAIGGAVTYFFLRQQAQGTATLQPSVGPGFAGFSYSGTF